MSGAWSTSPRPICLTFGAEVVIASKLIDSYSVLHRKVGDRDRLRFRFAKNGHIDVVAFLRKNADRRPQPTSLLLWSTELCRRSLRLLLEPYAEGLEPLHLDGRDSTVGFGYVKQEIAVLADDVDEKSNQFAGSDGFFLTLGTVVAGRNGRGRGTLPISFR